MGKERVTSWACQRVPSCPVVARGHSLCTLSLTGPSHIMVHECKNAMWEQSAKTGTCYLKLSLLFMGVEPKHTTKPKCEIGGFIICSK